ncbi:MAG: SprB repeat-containing protein [Chitinophagales bacterium]|nr:SprB repeat-containing protein [Chitinophagales bacterium]
MKQTTSIQKKETTMKENQEPVHQSRMNESFFVRRPAAPGGQHAGSAVNAYNLQPVTVKREPAILNHTMFFMKKFLRRGGMFITAMLFANLFFALSSFSQVVVVNPTSPWTVPAGVTSIKVEVWGAGGGGGRGGSFWGDYGGGGGGGGAYNVATFSVTQGQVFTIIIGEGGATSNDGGNTTVSGSAGSVIANGGKKGSNAGLFWNGAGGTGGTDGLYHGGTGGTSTGNGAGGGGGAGNNGNGSDGGNAVTGSGGAGTYAGGNGGAFRGDNGNGNNGVAPGGGGAGGRGSNNNGGTGGDGQVIISYCPTITASATKNDVQCFNTSTGQIIVSGSGGTAPYTFSIDNGTSYQASNTFSNLPIGTYQIRVKDANGCESKSVQ